MTDVVLIGFPDMSQKQVQEFVEQFRCRLEGRKFAKEDALKCVMGGYRFEVISEIGEPGNKTIFVNAVRT